MLLPMMRVVQPAYHCAPKGGKGSFWPGASRELSCVRVFANSAGYVIAISTAPAVLPAIMLRKGDGFSFLFVEVVGGGAFVWMPVLGIVVVILDVYVLCYLMLCCGGGVKPRVVV